MLDLFHNIDPRIALVGLPFVGAAAAYAINAIPYKDKNSTPGDSRVSEEIPYQNLLDDYVVQTTHGTYGIVFKIKGAIYAGRDQAAVENIINQRFQWLMSLRDKPLQGRCFYKRGLTPIHVATCSNEHLDKLNKLFLKDLANAYSTDIYLVLSTRTGGTRTSLDEALDDLPIALNAFGVSPMSLTDIDREYSPLLKFLGWTITGIDDEYPPQTTDLNYALCNVDINWKRNGWGMTSIGLEEKYWRVLSIARWGDHSTELLVEQLLTVPGDISIYAHFECMSREQARQRTKYNKKQEKIKQQKDGAEEEGNEVNNAEFKDISNQLQRDENGLAEFEFAVFVHASTQEECESLTKQIQQVLRSHVEREIVEKGWAQRWYQNRLFSHDYFTRPFFPGLDNLAEWLTFKAEPRGSNYCEWGNGPVRYIPTAGGRTPYGLIYHLDKDIRSNAHCAFIGQSGQGKSVIAAFLGTGAMSAYPDLHFIAFDKDFGLTTITEYTGEGQYLIPETSSLPLNPFDVEDTEEQRSNLHRFLAMLSGASDDQDMQDIEHAIDHYFSLPKDQRVLKNGFDMAWRPGKMKQAMKKWAQSNRHGRLFNSTKDVFNSRMARMIVTDMTNLLDDPDLSAALVMYISDKIDRNIGRRNLPHILFVDEAAQILQSEPMADESSDWLNTKRRQRGSVQFAFTNLEAMYKSPAASTLKTQIATYFIWPGTCKDPEICKDLNLTEWETDFVMGRAKLTHGIKRPVLLKRETESVLLESDLSSLGKHMKFFQGGSGPTFNLYQAIQKYGENEWRSQFLKM